MNRPNRSRILLLLCIVVSLPAISVDYVQPDGLTVNFLLNPDQVYLDGYPVNVDLKEAVNRKEQFHYTEVRHKQPLFGWLVPSPGNNTIQVAYRIMVGTSYEALQNNVGDMWDSGKINSEQSINIRYEGKFLQPDQVYFWKVKTWDNHGLESSFSAIRQFKTASALIDYYGYEYPGTTMYPLQKQDVSPVRIKAINESNSLVDFGKANFGRLRVTLFGDASPDTVLIHLGESAKDGRIDREPGGNIKYDLLQVVLKQGWNTYEILIPPHEYNRPERIIHMPGYIGEVMPFRYCELEDYPGHLLDKESIQQVSVHYPFDEEASDFVSADTVLNAVWDLCKHTVRATSFAGIYVDGNRERFPREADSYINQLSHYGVEREFSLARHTHEFQIGYSSKWSEWIMHVVLSAWADYMETGDPSSMDHFYPQLKAKTLMALAREDGLISTRTGLVTMDVIKSVNWHEQEFRRRNAQDPPVFSDIVDWPNPGRWGLTEEEAATDGFEFTEINTVVNAFHYRCLVLMEKIASVLDRTRDAELFRNRAERVRRSFNDVLLDPETGIYRDGEDSRHSSLHANMFPLAFGLVPEENVDKVAGFIKSRGMACSPYGSLYLLESLYAAGEAGYALELLTSTGPTSWGRWIYEFGSTISLEAWGPEYKPNLDWNHAWGSAPGSVIPRKLMGIEPIEPGYRKIRIKPQPASLPAAEIRLPTIRGDVQVSFTSEPGESFELFTHIPANMQAEIYLPKLGQKPEVTMNDKPVEYEVSGNFIKIANIGSGGRTFKILKFPR